MHNDIGSLIPTKMLAILCLVYGMAMAGCLRPGGPGALAESRSWDHSIYVPGLAVFRHLNRVVVALDFGVFGN